jgi:hypothetical protein
LNKKLKEQKRENNPGKQPSAAAPQQRLAIASQQRLAAVPHTFF